MNFNLALAIDMATLSPFVLKLMTLLNLVICALLTYACIRRVAVMSKETTAVRFKISYVVLVVAANASGLGYWLFGDQAGPGQILMSGAVLCWLGMGGSSWDTEEPPYARKDHRRTHRRSDDPTGVRYGSEGGNGS